MKYTTNYNLNKPDLTDIVDIQDLNDNTDIIDQKLKENAQAIEMHLADYVKQTGYAAATGSANVYAITLNPAPTEYIDGMCIAVKIANANTGASTINVNGLGAKAIKKSNGNDVSSGNLKAGSIYTLRYNATSGNFILQGEGGEYGTAGPEQVLVGYTVGTENGVVAGTYNKIYGPGDVLIKYDAPICEQVESGTLTINSNVGEDGPYAICEDDTYIYYACRLSSASTYVEIRKMNKLTKDNTSLCSMSDVSYSDSGIEIMVDDNNLYFRSTSVLKCYNKNTGALVWSNTSVTSYTPKGIIADYYDDSILTYGGYYISRYSKSNGVQLAQLNVISTYNVYDAYVDKVNGYIYVFSYSPSNCMVALSKLNLNFTKAASDNTYYTGSFSVYGMSNIMDGCIYGYVSTKIIEFNLSTFATKEYSHPVSMNMVKRDITTYKTYSAFNKIIILYGPKNNMAITGSVDDVVTKMCVKDGIITICPAQTPANKYYRFRLKLTLS